MLLDQEINIGKLPVQNCLVMPPMQTNKTEAGHVTDALVDYYRERAVGSRPGIIITEHSCVASNARAAETQLSIAADDMILVFNGEFFQSFEYWNEFAANISKRVFDFRWNFRIHLAVYQFVFFERPEFLGQIGAGYIRKFFAEFSEAKGPLTQKIDDNHSPLAVNDALYISHRTVSDCFGIIFVLHCISSNSIKNNTMYI